MMTGTEMITDPAMSRVLGTSWVSSCWTPRDSVHRSRLSTRNRSANRNSFQAIMNTYKATAAMAGAESGSVIRRITPKRDRPSIRPASSSDAGTVWKWLRNM